MQCLNIIIISCVIKGHYFGLCDVISIVFHEILAVLLVSDTFFFAANTALIYHHGKLMALSEADKPCKFSTHYVILFYGTYALLRKQRYRFLTNGLAANLWLKENQ